MPNFCFCFYFGLYIEDKNNHVTTTITGVIVGVDVTAVEKIWRCLQALGDIAFAYAFSMVLVEIQVTPD